MSVVTGENITIQVPKNYKAKMLRITGKSVQTGTPTPENIQVIDNVTGNVNITVTNSDNTESQTFIFPLGTDKLMLGDYLADDGIYHIRKQIELNGSENESWYYDGTVGGNSAFIISVSDIINLIDNSDTQIRILCNKFVGKSSYDFFHTPEENTLAVIQNKRIDLVLNDNSITTGANFKTWLSENPIIVEYELETPTITSYTTIQKDAWNKLKNIILYEGTNNINTSNEIQPELKLNYYPISQDFNMYISEDGYLIIPDYNIKYLINFYESNIPSMAEATEATVRIAGKDGDITLNTTYEPISFNIVCYTNENLTPEQKKGEEEKINMFLNSIKNNIIPLNFEREEKFYNVKYSGALTVARFPKHIKFSIPLKSSESYAKFFLKSEVHGNTNFESNTVKDVGAVFTIIGPATSPIIALNNYEMSYDGSILEGNKLIIDSGNSTIKMVTSLGVETNAMRYYNHQFPKIKKRRKYFKRSKRYKRCKSSNY